MEKSMILVNVSLEDFQSMIQEAIRKELAIAPENKGENYLTRENIRTKLHISLPTIDKAIKTGNLKAYRINGRILFKESEIILSEFSKKLYKKRAF